MSALCPFIHWSAVPYLNIGKAMTLPSLYELSFFISGGLPPSNLVEVIYVTVVSMPV